MRERGYEPETLGRHLGVSWCCEASDKYPLAHNRIIIPIRMSGELVGANEYVITWKVPLQKEAKTNFSCVIGSAAQEDVEPGFCTVGLMADAMKMRVRTYDVAGKPAKRPFHLACFRD